MENVTFAAPEVGDPARRQANVKKSDSPKARKDVSTQEKPDADEPVKEPVSSKSRKRTKTGCLTCRKRRIKCGEERPTCGNCVKSKRNCEGYTPRVIFKEPVHAYRTPFGATNGPSTRYTNIPSQGAGTGPFVRISLGSANPAALAPIAPRPSPPILQHGASVMQPIDTQGTPNHQLGLFGYTFDGETLGETDLPPRIPRDQMQPQYSYEKNPPVSGRGLMPLNGLESMQHPNLHHVSTGDSDSGIDMGCPGSSSEWSHSSTSSAGPPLTTPTFGHIAAVTPAIDNSAPPKRAASLPQALFPPQSDQRFPECWLNTTPESYQKTQWTSSGIQDRQQQCSPMTHEVQGNSPTAPMWHGMRGASQTTSAVPQHLQSGYMSYQQNVPIEEPEDDYWDVSSDDEMAVSNGCSPEVAPSDLGLMIAMSANQHGKSFRSLTSFLNEPNVLSSYRPTYAASPLRDPQTALVFCHFITATAPTISSSERRIVNAAAMFSGAPVPKAQQALWTYTMPMLALHNQGLLHAMLALSSLHIAKLQKSSPTPSLKHYHFALRKVAKSLSSSTKRNTSATLGAALLLGFYEVTTAEHNKWNSHLAGAKQLIMDLDFQGMARRIKTQKAQTVKSQKQSFNPHCSSLTQLYSQTYSQPYQYHDHPDDFGELDEDLISTIIGWQTKYNQYGQIINDEEYSGPPSAEPMNVKEMDDFETQVDLFWWYAKQDTFQSIVSGNRLLLPYERWSHIPPRSPVGRLDAIHGTSDHLFLLIARIADFAGKDLPRKKEMFARQTQQNSNTGCFFEGSNKQTSPTSGTSSTSYPLPPTGQYTPISTNHTPLLDDDLHTSTVTAQADWLAITRALDTLEEALGPSFAALSSEHMPPLSTPFGPALYYRTYSIACIWSLLYTGRIISARTHPSMPPAAMVAAGIAAPGTAVWANTIGRINAGIQPLSSSVPLNPLHGAALMDATMGLFHAGVQYRDAAQRGWTITKLRDVARLTGWQTSALIASGCERAWMRMAEVGKGPPYERTMNKTARDDRVAGRSRDPERGPPKDNNDRRFIHANPGTRVYWAMGILSVEEDMKGLDLES